MFKKFVKKIVELKTAAQADNLWFEIDIAFQHEKITWEDHQTLFKLLWMLNLGE